MKPLTVDEIRAALPDLEELRPLMDHVLTYSQADAAREWTGSAELTTSGDRMVGTSSLRRSVDAVAAAEHVHLAELFRRVTEAVLALEQEDGSAAAEALLRAAALEEGRDRPATAAAYADKALAIAREGPGGELVARCLRRRARGRWTAGEHRLAEQDYAAAYDRAMGGHDLPGSAEAAIGAGNVLEEQGRWDEAEAWYRAALDVLGPVDGPSPERWHALLNLHVTLRSRGALEESTAPLADAEAEAERLDDVSARPFLQNARGQLSMATGAIPEAIAHLSDALTAATGARAVVTIRLNLAEALFAAGRTLDAAEHARRAEQEALIAGLPRKLPEVYRLLGRIAAASGNPDAFVLFERALDIIRERRLPDLERALTLQTYAEAEERVGSAEAASELSAKADELYARLGIHHPRSEWADRHGADESDEVNDRDLSP
jgi:tetratricopeptide (TPR) repeat protein